MRSSLGTSASSRQIKKASADHARPLIRQQVAAACYRTGSRGIEFLLVRTRGGRWIFPKGGVEAGLTQAQSAALEAYEEAGAHGRIEEMPFARYHLTRSDGKKSIRKPRNYRDGERSPNADAETVTAHLCEVSHLEPPQEAYRMPTWFSPEKAKRRLIENRDHDLGEELANVVDRAVSRIRRLEASTGKEFQNDALRKVRFEAFEDMHLARWGNPAVLRQLLMDARGARSAGSIEADAAPSQLRRKKSYEKSYEKRCEKSYEKRYVQ
ncbi:MAG: NUDIX domain-containing protein [Terriglobales bacterium]